MYSHNTMQTFDRHILSLSAALLVVIAMILAAGERVGIGVRSVFPSNDSEPPSTASLRIQFVQPMEHSSVEERFSVEPALSGQIVWEGNTFVFEPTYALEPGDTYTVTVRAGAASESGRTLQHDISWSFIPRFPTVFYLVRSNDSASTLWSIDTLTGVKSEIYAPDFGVYDFAISRASEQMAVTSLNEDGTTAIWIMNLNGQDRHVLPSCAPGSCSGPAWSPDGKFLAYQKQASAITGSPGPNRVWLYDLASDTTSPLFADEQVLGFAPHWSRDGNTLAFFDANSEAIRIQDMATGLTTLIPNQMGDVGSFSPDGSRIVYADIRLVGRQFFSELWITDTHSEAGMQPLLTDAEEDRYPVWSPDGSWIAFTRRRLDQVDGLGRQVILVNPVTLEIYPLTEDTQYNNTRFAWSPTGQQLLVQRFDLQSSNSEPELWVFDVGNNVKTVLVKNAYQGIWAP